MRARWERESETGRKNISYVAFCFFFDGDFLFFLVICFCFLNTLSCSDQHERGKDMKANGLLPLWLSALWLYATWLLHHRPPGWWMQTFEFVQIDHSASDSYAPPHVDEAEAIPSPVRLISCLFNYWRWCEIKIGRRSQKIRFWILLPLKFCPKLWAQIILTWKVDPKSLTANLLLQNIAPKPFHPKRLIWCKFLAWVDWAPICFTSKLREGFDKV